MRRDVIIAATSAVLLATGAYGAFAILSGGGPPPVSLSKDAAPATSGNLAGSWTLSASDSFVGYRVREKLAFLPAPSDAVGRTTAVRGTMVIDGMSVRSVDVRADLRELESDRAMRDRRLHELGLETDRFPDARFELTSPITFDERPAAGRQIDRTAAGRLTLHGVTRDVSVPLRAQWSADRIEVIGSLEVQFEDYDIDQIRLNQVTTEDHGTMELELVFVPA